MRAERPSAAPTAELLDDATHRKVGVGSPPSRESGEPPAEAGQPAEGRSKERRERSQRRREPGTATTHRQRRAVFRVPLEHAEE
jgi:hypothetical protein